MKTHSKRNRSSRPSAPFPVGRTAEEYRLHQLSCEYWKSPITRQRLGLPDNETIRRAVLHVNRQDGVGMAQSVVQAELRQMREVRRAKKRKVWVAALPEQHPMTPIARAVAAAFGVAWPDLFRGGREAVTVYPRQAAMALIVEQHRWSLTLVADYFGKKDHNTVRFAIKAVRDRCEQEAAYAANVAAARRAVAELENQTGMKEELKNS